MLRVVKSYEGFNQRRYSNPWVAKVSETGRPDFSEKVGGYTGAWNTGDAGDLYVQDPEEGQVYAYGQKDRRGSKTEVRYCQFRDGDFWPIEKSDLIAVLNGERRERDR